MQVMFHPTQQNKLLSASVDGLVAVFDLANGLDEDDGFMVSYILRLLMSWPFNMPCGLCMSYNEDTRLEYYILPEPLQFTMHSSQVSS